MKMMFLALLLLAASANEFSGCAQKTTELGSAISSEGAVLEKLARSLKVVEEMQDECHPVWLQLNQLVEEKKEVSYPNPVACAKEIFNLVVHFSFLFEHTMMGVEDKIVEDLYLIIQDLSCMVVDCVE